MTDETNDATAETAETAEPGFTVQAGAITATNVPDGDYAVGTAKVRVTNGVPVVVDGDLGAPGDYAATAHADLAGQPAPGPISDPTPAASDPTPAASDPTPAASDPVPAASDPVPGEPAGPDPMAEPDAEPDGEHPTP